MQFQHSSFWDGWSRHNIQKKKARQSVAQEESRLEEIGQIQNTKEPDRFAPEQHQSDYELEVGDYIAAFYEEDHKPYIGKIIEADEDDVHATFIEASTSTINYRSSLKWPRHPDEIWIAKSDVLCVIPAPEQQGKSVRSFTLDQFAMENVLKKYDAWKTNK